MRTITAGVKTAGVKRHLLVMLLGLVYVLAPGLPAFADTATGPVTYFHMSRDGYGFEFMIACVTKSTGGVLCGTCNDAVSSSCRVANWAPILSAALFNRATLDLSTANGGFIANVNAQ